MKKFLFISAVAVISAVALFFTVDYFKSNHLESLIDSNVEALANTSPTIPTVDPFGKTECAKLYKANGEYQILICGNGCSTYVSGSSPEWTICK